MPRIPNDRVLESLARHRLGYIQFMHLGKPVEALKNLENSAVLAKKTDSEHFSMVLALRAMFRFYQGDKSSTEMAAEAVTAAEEWGLNRNLGYALEVLGLTLIGIGKLEDAENALSKGIAIMKELGDVWFLIHGYSGLASVLERMGNKARAAESYQRLEELAEQKGTSFYKAWSLLLKTGFYIRQNGLKETGPVIITSLQLAEESESPLLMIPACIAYAQLQLSRKARNSSAEDFLVRAMSEATVSGYTWPFGIEPWELGVNAGE